MISIGLKMFRTAVANIINYQQNDRKIRENEARKNSFENHPVYHQCQIKTTQNCDNCENLTA